MPPADTDCRSIKVHIFAITFPLAINMWFVNGLTKGGKGMLGKTVMGNDVIIFTQFGNYSPWTNMGLWL